MSTPPAANMDALNRARRGAARLRTEWLLLINSKMVTPVDAVVEAAQPQGRPLLKQSLRQLLLSQPGWGKTRADAVIGKILSVTDAKIECRQATISWLLDARAGGRRFAAWQDAFEPRTELSAPGFPYARMSNDV